MFYTTKPYLYSQQFFETVAPIQRMLEDYILKVREKTGFARVNLASLIWPCQYNEELI